MLESHSAPLLSNALSNIRPDQVSYQPPDVQNQPITLTLTGVLLEAARRAWKKRRRLSRPAVSSTWPSGCHSTLRTTALLGSACTRRPYFRCAASHYLQPWPATWEPTTSSLLTSPETTT